MENIFFCARNIEDYLTPLIKAVDKKIVDLEDKNLMAELLQTVKDVTKKIGLKSYRTQINTGKEAGQEVFHLHIHVLGRN